MKILYLPTLQCLIYLKLKIGFAKKEHKSSDLNPIENMWIDINESICLILLKKINHISHVWFYLKTL